MARLGIDTVQGLIYDGQDEPIYLALPTPVVSQATLIESPRDFSRIPSSLAQDPFGWVFREDSFDAITRVRRGRLYQKLGNQGWEHKSVYAHVAMIGEAIGRTDGRVSKKLAVYYECVQLLSKSRRGEGLVLAIGTSDAHSLWRIVQTEKVANGDVLVTLRAESALGILPELDTSRVHPTHLPMVRSAIERVLAAAHREQPISVVDQCRNACAVLISRWLHQEGEGDAVLSLDLNDCIRATEAHFQKKGKKSTTLSSALNIPRQLHPRGKDPERESLLLRPVSEEDAKFAIHAVGFVIREIRWAME